MESAERYRILSFPSRGTTEQRHGEHLAILKACSTREPERATEGLRDHLAATVEALSYELRFDIPPELTQVEVATYLDLAMQEDHDNVELSV